MLIFHNGIGHLNEISEIKALNTYLRKSLFVLVKIENKKCDRDT